MRIGSLNIRELGSQIKMDEVQHLYIENKLDFCCIQETKMVNFTATEGRQM